MSYVCNLIMIRECILQFVIVNLTHSTHAHLVPCLATKLHWIFYRPQYKKCGLCPYLTHTFWLITSIKSGLPCYKCTSVSQASLHPMFSAVLIHSFPVIPQLHLGCNWRPVS